MIPKSSESGEGGRDIREVNWRRKRTRILAGHVIVKFKAPPAEADQTALSLSDGIAKELDGRVKRYPGRTGRAVIVFDPETSVLEVVKRLARRDDVEYAEPDVVDREQIVPTDTRYVDQWSHPLIGSEDAWNLETGAAGVLIGIIDSGISTSAAGALDHPDLNAPGRYTLGTDFVDGGAPRDLRGHGTHVAGIAAAESNNAQGVVGMNWASPVYICRTLDANGNGSSADFADAVEEIVDFAVAHNLHAVINYSAGGADNLTKQGACQYAQARGVLLCAATGNDNGGPVIWPAAYSTTIDNVIAVGSTDSNDTVSSFSNVGPEVTVVAPGRGIVSTMPTYAVTIPAALNYDALDGTSMATPLVTGLVSLMWSRHPSFTHTAIRDCLTGTAVKLGAGAFNNAWGNGRIDAEAALRCGDLVFPTIFTRFTRFTFFTRFTRFTFFTRFTHFTIFTLFTRFTPFTRFTIFTRFTRFTSFTLFTRFTRFTRFPVATRFFDPRRRRQVVSRFVRVGRTVFELSETEIRRFEELKSAEADLRQVGVLYLHELASSDRDELAASLKYPVEEVDVLLKLAKQVLSTLSER
jgi:Subtilase family